MRMAPRKNAAAPRRRKLRLARVTAGVAAACIALAAPVAVADPPALDITPHADITVEATSSSGATVNFTLDTNIPATVTCNPASGSVFGITTTTVSCTATDGTTTTPPTSFSVTVRDTTGPAVSVPGDMTLEATSGAGRDVTFSASASDAVDGGGLSASCTPSSGSTFPLGQTTVNCSATDTHSNTGAASFKVNIVDNTPPVLSLPGNQSASTSNSGGTAVSFSASANDNIAGSVPVSCSPSSGSNFPIGTTTVNCSANDGHGNTAGGSFTVTVTLTDTTPPNVTVPADITGEATSGNGAAVSFSSSAQDNVDGSLPTTCSPSSGSTFPLGATTVTCHATDAHGNTGTDTFKVTIRDTTAPTVTAPADITREATSSGGVTVTFSASATDAVDGGLSAPCSPASGTTFGLGSTTVTCHATDAHGNTGNDSFTVKVVDTTPPTLNLPSNQSASTTTLAGTTVSFSASASDSVAGSIPVSCSPSSGSNFSIGTTTVNCSANDGHGNTASGSFSVTVTLTDTTPPIVTVPADITREATSGSGAVVTLLQLGTGQPRREPAHHLLASFGRDVPPRSNDRHLSRNGRPRQHRHRRLQDHHSRHHSPDRHRTRRHHARSRLSLRRSRHLHCLRYRHRRWSIVGDVLARLRHDVRARVDARYLSRNRRPRQHRQRLIHRQSGRHRRSDCLRAGRSDARGKRPRRRTRDVHDLGDRQRRRPPHTGGHRLPTRVGVAVPARQDHGHLQRVGHQWERGSCLIRSHRRRHDRAPPERPGGDHDDQSDLATRQ